MANYSEIRNILSGAKTMFNDIVEKLGAAIGNYVATTSTISEEDILNMVKDLPQETQVRVLAKALTKVNVKGNAPSYLNNSKSGYRRSLL